MRGLRLSDVSHSRRAGSSACCNHQQPVHVAGPTEPKMTATFFTTVRKASLVLALTAYFAAVSSTASLRLQL